MPRPKGLFPARAAGMIETPAPGYQDVASGPLDYTPPVVPQPRLTTPAPSPMAPPPAQETPTLVTAPQDKTYPKGQMGIGEYYDRAMRGEAQFGVDIGRVSGTGQFFNPAAWWIREKELSDARTRLTPSAGQVNDSERFLAYAHGPDVAKLSDNDLSKAVYNSELKQDFDPAFDRNAAVRQLMDRDLDTVDRLQRFEQEVAARDNDAWQAADDWMDYAKYIGTKGVREVANMGQYSARILLGWPGVFVDAVSKVDSRKSGQGYVDDGQYFVSTEGENDLTALWKGTLSAASEYLIERELTPGVSKLFKSRAVAAGTAKAAAAIAESAAGKTALQAGIAAARQGLGVGKAVHATLRRAGINNFLEEILLEEGAQMVVDSAFNLQNQQYADGTPMSFKDRMVDGFQGFVRALPEMVVSFGLWTGGAAGMQRAADAPRRRAIGRWADDHGATPQEKSALLSTRDKDIALPLMSDIIQRGLKSQKTAMPSDKQRADEDHTEQQQVKSTLARTAADGLRNRRAAGYSALTTEQQNILTEVMAGAPEGFKQQVRQAADASDGARLSRLLDEYAASQERKALQALPSGAVVQPEVVPAPAAQPTAIPLTPPPATAQAPVQTGTEGQPAQAATAAIAEPEGTGAAASSPTIARNNWGKQLKRIAGGAKSENDAMLAVSFATLAGLKPAGMHKRLIDAGMAPEVATAAVKARHPSWSPKAAPAAKAATPATTPVEKPSTEVEKPTAPTTIVEKTKPTVEPTPSAAEVPAPHAQEPAQGAAVPTAEPERAKAGGEIPGMKAAPTSSKSEQAKAKAQARAKAQVEIKTKEPWEIADEAIGPYVVKLSKLSDKELRAEDRSISDAINKWARDNPAMLPNGTLNPKLGRDQYYFNLSAQLKAIGKEQEARKSAQSKAEAAKAKAQERKQEAAQKKQEAEHAEVVTRPVEKAGVQEGTPSGEGGGLRVRDDGEHQKGEQGPVAKTPQGNERVEKAAELIAKEVNAGETTNLRPVGFFMGIAERIVRAVDSKDGDYLASLIARVPGENDGSKHAFEYLTGTKLPKGVAKIRSFLDEWAGVTAEERTRRTAEKQKAQEGEHADRELEYAGRVADGVKVRLNGEETTIKKAVDDLFAKGFTRLRDTGKVGGQKWVLINPETMTEYPAKGVMLRYARAKLAAEPAKEQTQSAKAETVSKESPRQEITTSAGIFKIGDRVQHTSKAVVGTLVRIEEYRGQTNGAWVSIQTDNGETFALQADYLQAEEQKPKMESEEPTIPRIEVKSPLANLSAEKQARAKELQDRIRKRLLGSAGMAQMLDPEILTAGAELTALYVEGGTKTFAQFAQNVRADMADTWKRIKRYLHAIWQAAGADNPDLEDISRKDAEAVILDIDTKTPIEDTTDGGTHEPIQPERGQVAVEPVAVAEGQPAPAVAGTGEGAGETPGSAGPSGAVSTPSMAEGRKGGRRQRAGKGNRPVGAVPGAGEPARTTGTADSGQGVGSDQGSREVRAGRDLTPEDNLRIQSDDEIVPATRSQRIKANVKAIRLLKKLESENHLPSPEEKRVLVQFSGWGDLFQVFGETSQEDFGAHVDTKDDDLPYYMRDETKKALTAWRKQYGEAFKALSPAHEGLLTEEQWQSAKESALNAHFTSREVINAMWAIAERLGFKGGVAVEPSAGIGHFIGLTPNELAGKVHWMGVELDDMTGRMLAKLYPASDIQVTGFEDAKRLTANSADLVISNFPFGDYPIADPKHKDYDGWNIHNYFAARALDVVKPGGIVLAITSHHTLDASGGRAMREYLAGKADLIGAMRLPFTAFKANAGTEVVTDILVLRKKTPGYTSPNRFADTAVVKIGDQDVSINRYFAEHPDMIIGKQAMSGKMYARKDVEGNVIKTYNVEPSGDVPLVLQMAKAMMDLPENVMGSEGTAETAAEAAASVRIEGKKAGSYTVTDDGKVMQVDAEGVAHPPDWSDKAAQVAKAKKLIGLRDALLKQIDLETDEQSKDADISENRKELNALYDKFVKTHGAVNDKGNDLLDDDPEWPLVAALEDEGSVAEEATHKSGPKKGEKYTKMVSAFTKGLPLRQRFVFQRKIPGKAESIEDAVSISINYKGDVLTEYVAQMLGITPEAAKAQMLEKELAFDNPNTGLLETPDVYLSGPVRDKLLAARNAAAEDKRFDRNVTALEKVQPAMLAAERIYFRLGSNWLSSKQIERFVSDVLDMRTRVTFVRTEDQTQWSLELLSKYQTSVKNTETWAVDYGFRDKEGKLTAKSGKIVGTDLVEQALNLKLVEASWTEHDRKEGDKHYKDAAGTAAARDMQNRLQDEFRRWVLKSPEESKEVESTYNRLFNGIIAPKTTVPDIETFPGANPDIKLRDWQKRVAVRAVRNGVIIAHSVGTGKTYSLQTIAMEMRRLKTATKPMIVVQNATLGQFARSFKLLYPQANILVGNEKRTKAENRAAFVSQAVTRDWDAIVIPRSFFDSIPNDPVRERDYVQERMNELEDMIVEAERAAGNTKSIDFEKSAKALKSTVGKALLRTRKRYQARLERTLKRMAEMKDDLITFEKMGVDALLVDEAHAYKRGDFFTKMDRVKGLDTNGSTQSMDFLMKTQWIQNKTPGRNVILASGTPISNTLAEMWTMMRYVRPDILRKYGADTFDDFVGTFATTVAEIEETPTGDFRQVLRLARYVNGPEMGTLWRTGADVYILDRSDLPGVPQVKGGQPTEVVIERPEYVGQFVDFLRKWRAWWENLPGDSKQEWNYVPILQYGLARKAAIDMRLVDPRLPDLPDSKTNRIVDEVFKRWQATKDISGTQLVFSNIYRSHDPAKRWLSEDKGIANPLYGVSAFSLFDDMRKKLIAKGIPAQEIADVSEIASKTQKETTAELIKTGQIRVAFGSTETLGTGLNIQDHIVAIHHVDPMFRPMDFEQRNGRGVRQGNQNTEIEILVYGTKRTLDSTLYQLMLVKQKFITQAQRSETLDREFDDPSDESTMSFQTMAAAFSGNPMHARRFALENEVRRLSILADQDGVRKRAGRELLGQITSGESSFEAGVKRFRTSIAKVQAAFPNGGVDTVAIDNVKKEGEDARKLLNAKIEDGYVALEKELQEAFASGTLKEENKALFEAKKKGNYVPSGDRSWRNDTIIFADINGLPFKFTFRVAYNIAALLDGALAMDRVGTWNWSNETLPYFQWTENEPWYHGEYTPNGNVTNGPGFQTGLRHAIGKYQLDDAKLEAARHRISATKADLIAQNNAPFDMDNRLKEQEGKLREVLEQLQKTEGTAAPDETKGITEWLGEYPKFSYITRLVRNAGNEAQVAAFRRADMEKTAKEFFAWNGSEFMRVRNTKASPVRMVKIPGFEDINVFMWQPKPGKWSFTHEDTGYGLGSYDKMGQKEAIAGLVKKLNTLGRVKIDNAIAEAMRVNISPRLAARDWLANKSAEAFAPGVRVEWKDTKGETRQGTVKEVKQGAVYVEMADGSLEVARVSQAKALPGQPVYGDLADAGKPDDLTNINDWWIKQAEAHYDRRRTIQENRTLGTDLYVFTGGQLALQFDSGLQRRRDFERFLQETSRRYPGAFNTRWTGVRVSRKIEESQYWPFVVEHFGRLGYKVVGITKRKWGACVDEDTKTVFWSETANGEHFGYYIQHETAHILARKNDSAFTDLVKQVDRQSDRFLQMLTVWPGYTADEMAEELAAAIVGGMSGLTDALKTDSSELIARIQSNIRNNMRTTGEAQRTTGPPTIDDLMLAGWGVANQLPEGNYVRQAWDAAFRIAVAADKAGQADLAMRELRKEAPRLMQEVWKTGNADPYVQEMVSRLRGVLAGKRAADYGDISPEAVGDLVQRVMQGMSEKDRAIEITQAVEKRAALSKIDAAREKARERAQINVKKAKIAGRVQAVQKYLQLAQERAGRVVPVEEVPTSAAGAVSAAWRTAEAKGRLEMRARRVYFGVVDAVQASVGRVRRRMAGIRGGRRAYEAVLNDVANAAQTMAEALPSVPDAMQQYEMVRSEIGRLFLADDARGMMAAAKGNPVLVARILREYSESELHRLYVMKLRRWFGGAIVKSRIFKDAGGEPKEVLGKPSIKANDMLPQYRDAWKALTAKIDMEAIRGEDWRQLKEWHDEAAYIIAQNYHDQQQIAGANTMRRTTDAEAMAEEVQSAATKLKAAQKGTPRKATWWRRFNMWRMTQRTLATHLGDDNPDSVTSRVLYEDPRSGNTKALTIQADKLREWKAFADAHGLTDSRLIDMSVKRNPIKVGDQTVYFTDMQRIAFAANWKDAGNRDNILRNGFKGMEFRSGNQEHRIWNEDADIRWQNAQDVLATITPKEQAIADKMVELLTSLGKEGNEVSMRQLGRELFSSDSYFPLKVDRNDTIQTVDMDAGKYSQQLPDKMGLTKDRLRHHHAVLIGDALDIFHEHLSEMSSYIGMAIPVRDALTVLGNPVYAGELKDRFGESTVTRIKETLSRLAGLRSYRDRWNTLDRAVAAIERRAAVAILGGRVTSTLWNRVGGSLLIMGVLPWQAKLYYLIPKRLPFVILPGDRAILDKLFKNGYFQDRWENDMQRTFANLAEKDAVARSKFILNWQRFQRLSLHPMAIAEQKNAINAYRSLRMAGMEEAEALHEVEMITRQTQNPSTALEETGEYQTLKETPVVSLVFPFLGQPTVAADLAMQKLLILRGAIKRKMGVGAALWALIGVLLALIGNAAFMVTVRDWIRKASKGVLGEKTSRREEDAQELRMIKDASRELLDLAVPGIGRVLDTTLEYLKYGRATDSSLLARQLQSWSKIYKMAKKAHDKGLKESELEKLAVNVVETSGMTLGIPVGPVQAVKVVTGLAGDPLGEE